ncbi:hypothetical protein [Microbulbifer sp. TYP-18]|uniref:hypothetical protein n=1 Tax=Microbulbifer sp. TYP-18 TaxID=3230024 RepID=UPI0034C63FC6
MTRKPEVTPSKANTANSHRLYKARHKGFKKLSVPVWFDWRSYEQTGSKTDLPRTAIRYPRKIAHSVCTVGSSNKEQHYRSYAALKVTDIGNSAPSTF